MKIGLYFGSFNPIHIGHLLIANHILNFTSITKIWFVVSPQNPLKPVADLLNSQARLDLVKAAIEDDTRLAICDAEFHLPVPSYTIDSLAYLKCCYPNYEFLLIIGSDNFLNLSSWKAYEAILQDFKTVVYERPGFPVSKNPGLKNVEVLNSPLFDISSTEIRKLIKEGKSSCYLLPEKVHEAIILNKYYK